MGSGKEVGVKSCEGYTVSVVIKLKIPLREVIFIVIKQSCISRLNFHVDTNLFTVVLDHLSCFCLNFVGLSHDNESRGTVLYIIGLCEVCFCLLDVIAIVFFLPFRIIVAVKRSCKSVRYACGLTHDRVCDTFFIDCPLDCKS